MKQTSSSGKEAAWGRPDPEVRAMTVPQVARAYHVSAATIWRGIAAGRIKTIRPSGNPHGRRLVLLSSLEQDPKEMETA